MTMTRIYLIISCCLVMMACRGNENKGEADGGQDTSDVASSPVTVSSVADTTSSARHILFPHVAYRIYSEQDRVSPVIGEGGWYEFFRIDKDLYMLQTAFWHVEEVEEEPCSGMPGEKLIPGMKDMTQLFLKIPGLFDGGVKVYPTTHGVLSSGESLPFGDDDSYKLTASGTDFRAINKGAEGIFHLDFYENDKLVQRLIEQSEYRDTKTEVWIFDLNDDDKPDFILSSPRNDKEYRIIIWLSGENRYTRYEEALGFDDC